ncbi:hypothetical protein RJ641_018551, partial [Dillenia turbinata]
MTSGVLPSQIAVDPVLATPHKSLALWRRIPFLNPVISHLKLSCHLLLGSSFINWNSLPCSTCVNIPPIKESQSSNFLELLSSPVKKALGFFTSHSLLKSLRAELRAKLMQVDMSIWCGTAVPTQTTNHPSPLPCIEDLLTSQFSPLDLLLISASTVSTTESASDELEPLSSALIPSFSTGFFSSSSNMGGSCSGLTSTMCSLNMATESVLSASASASASASFTKRLSTQDSANLSSAVH